MCPSTSVENATVFLGMIGSGGRVAYVSPAVPLSRDDIEALPADERRPLEAQYRFAGPCVESECGHWSGSHCGLGELIADAGEAADLAGESNGGPSGERLAKCGIRPQCRWYADQGARACRACPRVVTDLRVAVPG